ncbi:MAG: T9SS type A sorting domain-containing protein [Bacteroidetes bacterium]|nr:T9SS type A sorting domain-containing protein [Bacteroidota bacterium]
MQNLPSVDPAGVHLAGDFQGNNPATTYMYSFTPGIYEVISYMPAGTYEYKFYNGNTSGATETVPGTCASNGNRFVDVTKDSVMMAYCFSGCGLCAIGINEYTPKIAYSLYPIPAAEATTIEFEHAVAPVQINIIDQSGKIVRSYNGFTGSKLTIDRGDLSKGVYFISVKNYSGEKLLQTKLIFG